MPQHWTRQTFGIKSLKDPRDYITGQIDKVPIDHSMFHHWFALSYVLKSSICSLHVAKYSEFWLLIVCTHYLCVQKQASTLILDILLLFLQALYLLSEDLFLLHRQLLLLVDTRLCCIFSTSWALSVPCRGHPGAERRRLRVGAALPNTTFALRVHTQDHGAGEQISATDWLLISIWFVADSDGAQTVEKLWTDFNRDHIIQKMY